MSVYDHTTKHAAPATPHKSPSLLRLAACALGICISYCAYGLLQESLFTGVHLGPTFCLLTACITNVLVALVWEWIEQNVLANSENRGKPEHKKIPDQINQPVQLPHRLLVLTSFLYVLAMTCSNEAIPHVSYPVAVLAKSCKLIPTMVVGELLEKKSHTTMEWLAALSISVGISLFHSTHWRIDANQDEPDPSKRTLFGITLLVVSLLSDGLLSSCQNLIKHCSKRDARFKPPTAVQTMLYVNLYALMFLAPLAYWNGQLSSGTLERVCYKEPILAWNLMLLNSAAGIGQVFIFLTITWYTPVLCTTITTTRKFITILLSVYAFGHSFTTRQWLAIALVFGGLYTVILVQHRTQSRHVESLKAKVE